MKEGESGMKYIVVTAVLIFGGYFAPELKEHWFHPVPQDAERLTPPVKLSQAQPDTFHTWLAGQAGNTLIKGSPVGRQSASQKDSPPDVVVFQGQVIR